MCPCRTSWSRHAGEHSTKRWEWCCLMSSSWMKINYKPGAGYDDFYGWEHSDDVSGDLDRAYYMHREWRRQFFDSTRGELYFEMDDRWTWGTLTVGWFTDGYKFMSLQKRRGRRMPYLKEDWRGYTCFFCKRRATFENPLTQEQWENLWSHRLTPRCEGEHVWSISYCTGWRMYRAVKFLKVHPVLSWKALKNIGLKETHNPKNQWFDRRVIDTSLVISP